MKAAWIGVVGVTVAVLGGCMMGPDYRRPDLPVPETYRFLPEDASLQALDSRWWEDFGDPVLNGMVEEAIANNRRRHYAGPFRSVSADQYKCQNGT